MIYIVSSLPKDEIHSVLPNIVALPSVGVKAALKRLIHASPPPLTPEKLIVAMHKLVPTKTLSVRKIAGVTPLLDITQAANPARTVFLTILRQTLHGNLHSACDFRLS